MNRIRFGKMMVYAILGISMLCVDASAQSALDTMVLNLVPPDSVYVMRDGSTIVIGWYPPKDGEGSITGSRDFTNWYVNDPYVSPVEIVGIYRGVYDYTVKVGRIITGSVTRDTVGYEPSIRMQAEIRVDKGDFYSQEFNLGSASYTPGDTIWLTPVGQVTRDTLNLGVGLIFGEGVVDTTFEAQPAYFQIDLQTYEGFHVWRGLSPNPSRMEVIAEYSRDEAFMGWEPSLGYFAEWPKTDASGREYYEFVDSGVFVGFTYYYIVSCFDKGYFKGKTVHNKTDNFICDEDPDNPATPGEPVECADAANVITMMVDAGAGIGEVYAVPNPYRTGTSAVSSAYYHNFPDGSIKFFNVPQEADIKIYTVSGDLVWETHHSDPLGDQGVVSWNVKNKEGRDVGSGVYIFRCENNAGEDVYGRIIVIR